MFNLLLELTTLDKDMNNANRMRIRYLLVCMMATMLSYGNQGIAATTPSDPPDQTLDYPAGLACSFELKIEVWNGNKQTRETKDKNGIVRIISAGTGGALRFTDVDTGQTLSTKSDGAVQIQKFNPDGSFIETDLGHTVLILFPTDIPPGPSTTLYVGKLVFSSDASFNFTVLNEPNNKTDICAAVGP